MKSSGTNNIFIMKIEKKIRFYFRGIKNINFSIEKNYIPINTRKNLLLLLAKKRFLTWTCKKPVLTKKHFYSEMIFLSCFTFLVNQLYVLLLKISIFVWTVTCFFFFDIVRKSSIGNKILSVGELANCN